VVPLRAGDLAPAQRAQLAEFLGKTMRLQRAALGTSAAVRETGERLRYAKKAIDDTPAKDSALADEARALEARLREIRVAVDGDQAASRRFYPTSPSITDRIGSIVNAQWSTSGPPTGTSLEQYAIASADLKEQTSKLAQLEKDVDALEKKMDAAGAPWTPGRVPVWSGE
jgi:chromosome segregation ATPase